ncbi:unnamed protein product [Boreogadus saida]
MNNMARTTSNMVPLAQKIGDIQDHRSMVPPWSYPGPTLVQGRLADIEQETEVVKPFANQHHQHVQAVLRARDGLTCSLPAMWEPVPEVPSHSSPPLSSVHTERPLHANGSVALLIREVKCALRSAVYAAGIYKVGIYKGGHSRVSTMTHKPLERKERSPGQQFPGAAVLCVVPLCVATGGHRGTVPLFCCRLPGPRSGRPRHLEPPKRVCCPG